MDRYKVSPAYKRRIVTPRYVWITVGSGRYTNQKSAEFIAKKNAGINGLYYDEVAKVDKTSFKLCTQEEFSQVTHGNKIYMYGTTEFVQGAGALSGCISAVVTDAWGGIAFGASDNVSLSRLQRSNLKQMHYEYENMDMGVLPQPTELTAQVECDADSVGCVIVAAMIVE